MNHKRGRCKNARSGCLMCKPNKQNGYPRGRGLEQVGHTGFGKLRDEYHAVNDLKEVDNNSDS